MKIVIVDTYYPAFLTRFYSQQNGLAATDYSTQLQAILNACFGTSDFYSRHLNSLGCEAQDLVVNCIPLQQAWANANNVPFSQLALKIPHRLFRVPLVGRFLADLPGLMDVAIAQIKAAKPDVLYCQDLSFFPSEVLRELKQYVRLVVGQIACPLPPESFLKGYDLILSSFPHFVDRLRALGVASEYFRIGFDERVLKLLSNVDKDIDFSFVGGISRNHGGAVPLLEHLTERTTIRVFGYGADSLPSSSPIHQRHGGEVWGLDMYRALARSRITLNRHINVAENNANNMRLFEATGVGSMLLTDRKDNLHKLFDIDSEVVAYSSKEEASEMVRYYLTYPEKAKAIAKAGQIRTLREHTYAIRMNELVQIIRHHLK
ncbi:GT4_ExpE7-like domain containing protein [Burkholderiaceae bacterium]